MELRRDTKESGDRVSAGRQELLEVVHHEQELSFAQVLDVYGFRIVVTDDRGRFLVPDLPMRNYKVWVRGYGLVDSAPIVSVPGKTLALKAIPAPDARAAAQIYPANYWYSLLQVPSASEFPFASDPSLWGTLELVR